MRRSQLALVVATWMAVASCRSRESSNGDASERFATLPGASDFSPELGRRLADAVAALGSGYQPRTRHKLGTRAKYVNRLILEASPYLRQHAHNPVNWFPWGQEAFAEAKRLGRPVLLSVGYSTCHWCHVMEEESFEDEDIARYLNENYVAIKVDRERRPDVDAIYMRAVRLLTGKGGWPMTVWLTPDGKPYFGGTYFPPRGRPGRGLGFMELLQRAKAAFDEHPQDVADTGAQLVARIEAENRVGAAGELPGTEVLAASIERYKRGYDRDSGGLRPAPGGAKFPSSLPIRVLLRYYLRSGDREVLDMATTTLDRMRAGGLYDHIGGGFHRYSTDARWLVPHFEKMLYDNARLAVAYLEAFQVTGHERFADTVRDILGYVEREMTAPVGAFYSATDADSASSSGEREEGAFFVWTRSELDSVLGDDADLAIRYFAVQDAGNFDGKSILHTPVPLADVARAAGLEEDAARSRLGAIRERLRAARAQRSAPARDEKILAGWNGLMISAYARAARALPAQRVGYLDKAERAAAFVMQQMLRDGRLLRSSDGARAEIDAYLDDYAFVIAALIDLFEATSTRRYLEQAIALDAVLARHYEDATGGYFRAADDAESLLLRDKPFEDGAIPSGNSAHALNLLRLHALTADDRYQQRADRLLRVLGQKLKEAPGGADASLLAVDFATASPLEVAVVARDAMPTALDEVAARSFLPHHVYVRTIEGAPLDELSALVTWLEGKVAIGGKATAYVCHRHQCKLPTSDAAVFAKQLAEITPLAPASDVAGRSSSDRPAQPR